MTLPAIQVLSEKENTMKCSLDLSLFLLPMVEKMWVLVFLEKNLQRKGKTFSFDNVTQDYFDTHLFDFKEIIKNESLSFVEFRENIFSEIVGSRFENIGLLAMTISSVYAQKRHFEEKKNVFNEKELDKFKMRALGLMNY